MAVVGDIGPLPGLGYFCSCGLFRQLIWWEENASWIQKIDRKTKCVTLRSTSSLLASSIILKWERIEITKGFQTGSSCVVLSSNETYVTAQYLTGVSSKLLGLKKEWEVHGLPLW